MSVALFAKFISQRFTDIFYANNVDDFILQIQIFGVCWIT
jgi:3-isopropylmalate dehydratase small subunit